jgi:ATP-dependent DNA helicase RecQ
MTKEEIKINLDNAVWGDYKFLYVSPERIATKRFQERLEQMKINLLTIDESHCISQWGYDFRPSYLKIAAIREMLPDVPVLALTATATPLVVKDIQDKLKFSQPNVLQKSFTRSNLKYLVRHEEDKYGYLARTLQKTKGSGIVYVRSRKRTKEITEMLRRHDVSSDYYHAGLSNISRTRKQDAWKKGTTRVMVATNAFGMGIDKPDVRFVIHIDVPDSLEAYYQEAGRAGRDEKKAAAVLLYNNSDNKKLQRAFNEKFPTIETIKRVYQALGNYFKIAVGFGKNMTFDFSIGDFARSYNMAIVTIYNSLKILQRCDYLELTEELDNPSRVHFKIHRDELYKFQIANEAFDAFIKLLLRSHTGLFSNYVSINEQLLADRAKSTTEVIYRYLNRLDALGTIHYIPQKKTPFIIYTKERLEERFLKISKEHYDERKAIYKKQIEAVLNYAQSKTKCRSQMLVEYFGELETKRCGVCDVCKSRNELDMDSIHFEKYSDQIKTILSKEPQTLEQLTISLQGNTDEAIKVCRWLLDNEKIQYRIDQKLEWKKS